MLSSVGVSRHWNRYLWWAGFEVTVLKVDLQSYVIEFAYSNPPCISIEILIALCFLIYLQLMRYMTRPSVNTFDQVGV